MAERRWVDDTHYAVTSDDGRFTYIYRDGGLWRRPTCVEIIEHRADGGRVTYEPADAFDSIFNGGRGRRKNGTGLHRVA